MSHEAIGAHFEQRGVLVLACAFDGLTDSLAHSEDVLPVALAARHVVGGAPLEDVVNGRRPLERGAHAVAIILDDEHAGQLPERGHVQRFVKRAGVHDGLAHEAHNHLIATAILDRETDTGRERYVSAHDAVPTKEVRVGVEHVHRTTLATRASILPTEQLGHYAARRDAARERLAVIAIGGDDVIIGAQHAERAGAHCFLPDIEVTEAAHLAQRVGFGRALLEAALQEHGMQELHVARHESGLRVGIRLLLGGHCARQ